MGKKKKFGHGPYADKPTRFTTIEQKVSAIRKFYDDALKDTHIANPARNARLEKVQVSSQCVTDLGIAAVIGYGSCAVGGWLGVGRVGIYR